MAAVLLVSLLASRKAEKGIESRERNQAHQAAASEIRRRRQNEMAQPSACGAWRGSLSMLAAGGVKSWPAAWHGGPLPKKASPHQPRLPQGKISSRWRNVFNGGVNSALIGVSR